MSPLIAGSVDGSPAMVAKKHTTEPPKMWAVRGRGYWGEFTNHRVRLVAWDEKPRVVCGERLGGGWISWRLRVKLVNQWIAPPQLGQMNLHWATRLLGFRLKPGQAVEITGFTVGWSEGNAP